MQGFFERLMAGELGLVSGVGVGFALLLVLAAAILLPAGERHRARGPLALLVGHVLLVMPRLLWGLSGWPIEVMEVLGTLLLLLSLGHGLSLVLMEALLARRLQQNPPRIFRDIVSGLVYAVAVLWTLRAAGVDTGSLLTTSALLTAIVGLSLQDTLGNLFAGLSLQGERPFTVGDWIEYGENVTRVGRVVEINWRATKVFTLEQVELTIPNGQLARATIFNYSKPSALVRRSVRIVVPRHIPTGDARQIMLAALVDIPGMQDTPAPSVVTEEFEEHGVRHWIRFYIADFSRRYLVESAVRDRIWYALSRAGIELAIPMRHIHMHDVSAAEKERRRDTERADFLAALSVVPLLAGLGEQDLRVLADAAEPLWFSDREVVVTQGQPGDSLFVCLEGGLEVRYSPEGAPAQTVATLGAGGVFGELSATTGELRTATVVAVQHSRLLRLGKQAFQRVLEGNPDLASTLSKRLSARRAELSSLAPKTERVSKERTRRDSDALLERIRSFLGIA